MHIIGAYLKANQAERLIGPKVAARRIELNRATEQLIEQAQEFEKLRDECNKSGTVRKEAG